MLFELPVEINNILISDLFRDFIHFLGGFFEQLAYPLHSQFIEKVAEQAAGLGLKELAQVIGRKVEMRGNFVQRYFLIQSAFYILRNVID